MTSLQELAAFARFSWLVVRLGEPWLPEMACLK